MLTCVISFHTSFSVLKFIHVVAFSGPKVKRLPYTALVVEVCVCVCGGGGGG